MLHKAYFCLQGRCWACIALGTMCCESFVCVCSLFTLRMPIVFDVRLPLSQTSKVILFWYKVMYWPISFSGTAIILLDTSHIFGELQYVVIQCYSHLIRLCSVNSDSDYQYSCLIVFLMTQLILWVHTVNMIFIETPYQVKSEYSGGSHRLSLEATWCREVNRPQHQWPAVKDISEQWKTFQKQQM